MMKNFIVVLILISAFSAFIGCSTSSENPISPEGITGENPLIAGANEPQGAALLGQWIMNIDCQNKTVEVTPDRSMDTHFNLTPYLRPEIVINSIDPVSQTVNADITLTNTFTVTGWDLRLIIYTDNIGHKLLNADEWTNLFDIPGGMPINPFRAYSKDLPQRQFFPGAEKTENFIIKLPGMNSTVRFAIEASYPYSCPEPYWINEFTQGALFDVPTSVGDVGVYVFNWLGDTSAVYVYCPQVSGSTLNSLSPNDFHWLGTIQNTMSAPPGNYFCYIIAYTTVSGSQALYDEFTLTVSEYATPVDPHVITTFDTSGAERIDLQDNYLYVADSAEGMKIFDISDPLVPYVVGIFDNENWFNDVTVQGNHVYAAAEASFFAINVMDKANPYLEYTYPSSGSPSGVTVEGSYAYFANGWLSSWIFNISNPSDWIYLSAFRDNEWATNIDVQGDLMMVADAGAGIQLVDISNREEPTLIKEIETSYAYDVLIDGNYAYVADDGDGIRVIGGLAWPPDATIVHSVEPPTSSMATKLAIQGNFLYAAYGAYGILIFDITTPETAYLFSSFDTDGSCEDIVVRDNYAYIADRAQGITIAKLW